MAKPALTSARQRLAASALLGMAAFASLPAHAETWSDTMIGWRYGTKFGEPFEGNDIHKNIFNLTHVGGYKYGTNFFNVDLLMSDKNDPSGPDKQSGAQEAYVVYRNTVDLSKITGTEYKWGPIRGIGATFGFDWNSKTDAGYNSKKRMLVAGPTVMLDVPGFFNIDLLALHESNAPCSDYSGTCVSRYTYDTHAALSMEWGIPIGSLPLSFEGFALFIAPKGKDEFGGNTKAETNIDAQVMLDVGAVLGGAPKTFKAGLEYQYWRNKFGNNHNGPAGSGAFAKTPMVRVEYHF
jgi:nucleoside-specific outer membrane channel protein Tsx